MAEAEVKRHKRRTIKWEADSNVLKRQLAALRTQLAAAAEARRQAEAALEQLGIASESAAAEESASLETETTVDPAPADPLPRAGRSLPKTRVGSAVRKARFRLADFQERVQNELAEARSDVFSILRSAQSQVAVKPPHLNGRAVDLYKKVARFRSRKAPANPLFDSGWIARNRPDLQGISYRKYLSSPELYAVDPHPLFAAQDYLERYPDVKAAGMSPLQHYLEHGWREGRDPHPYFANDWYVKKNPDVLEAGMNPLIHYVLAGWKEKRRPNPVFDPSGYLERYPDVAAAGLEPLTHYVVHGRDEKRDPVRGYGPEWKSLAPPDFEGDLMDFLLSGGGGSSLDEESAERALVRRARVNRPWPPHPLGDFILPYKLASFILDSHGDETLELFEYLCSVMDAYCEDPNQFPESAECKQLLERARTLSQFRQESQSGALRASVIIPVYNNFLDTLLCIVGLLESETESSFEIIIADDLSTDETGKLIGRIGGVVRHMRQPCNYGFLGNCNAAAGKARAETIVLLNNDTLVLPGWLDNLLVPFEQMPKIGLVGSKLLSWDGSLQEAGGIMWADGSAWNFGRNDDPLAPEYNYLKDVDYCSGASIAIPSELWRELKGFDPLFSPAYAEDADLAFRIRKAGYRTLYNPRSEVLHHEGRSHGRDTATGFKSYQVINQKKLFERWKGELEQGHYPNGAHVLKARDRSGKQPHILFIDHYVPQWDRDAGSRTIYQYIKIFLDLGWQVSFWPDNLFRDPIYTPLLQEMAVEVIYGPKFHDKFDDFIAARADLYDAAFLSRPHVAAKYVSAIRDRSRAKVIYYGHDLHFRRMERAEELGLDVDKDEMEDMRKTELDVCGNSDVIFYPDPDELRLLKKLVGGDRQFIANPVFVYDEQDLSTGRKHLRSLTKQKSHRLFFVGGFSHGPNTDGILWFVNEVMPKILDEIPDAKLDVAGSNPPPRIARLASKNVAILGLVSEENLQNLYANAALAIAPLRYGAGVKGKVIEAMAAGVPVATTSVGAQGIESPDKLMFIGDDAKSLANAIVRGIKDRPEAARKAKAAFEFVSRGYARAALTSLFGELLADAHEKA